MARGVRLVVAGEAKTGKTRLILTSASGKYPPTAPSVLSPTMLPRNIYPDPTPVTLVDTSSSPENRDKLEEELRRADAVVLTYACDKPETRHKLTTYWLPELRTLQIRVPVIVVGCMLDKRAETVSMEDVMLSMVQQYPEIERYVECSAFKLDRVPEVFYYAQNMAKYPRAPLLDKEATIYNPRFISALKRIFILYDRDKDGFLSDEELKNFQVKCFNSSMEPSEIVQTKTAVQERHIDSVGEKGLTLTGFLVLHALYFEQEHQASIWSILRKFGYNNEIRLSEDQLPPPIKRHPDQSVELTDGALDFLKSSFLKYDIDGDGALGSNELDDLFSTAPENPWSKAPYKDAAKKDGSGGLSLDGFLAEWALMTLLDPIHSVENLIYIGYNGEPSSAIRVTRRRRLDRKKQQSDRNVYQCFVFGPKEAGKSAILNSFIGRTTGDQYAVNVVDPGVREQEEMSQDKEEQEVATKILALRVIPEDGVQKLLSRKDGLSGCDIAIFVHDSSRETSRERAMQLLVDVASHGEAWGYEVPFLIVGARNGPESCLTEIQDSIRVSEDLSIQTHNLLERETTDFSNLFQEIVHAAERPHLNIPETEPGRRRKQYHRLIKGFHLVGGEAAIAGLAAYRIYAARKMHKRVFVCLLIYCFYLLVNSMNLNMKVL